MLSSNVGGQFGAATWLYPRGGSSGDLTINRTKPKPAETMEARRQQGKALRTLIERTALPPPAV